jgi:hypothetical protein
MNRCIVRFLRALSRICADIPSEGRWQSNRLGQRQTWSRSADGGRFQSRLTANCEEGWNSAGRGSIWLRCYWFTRKFGASASAGSALLTQTCSGSYKWWPQSRQTLHEMRTFQAPDSQIFLVANQLAFTPCRPMPELSRRLAPARNGGCRNMLYSGPKIFCWLLTLDLYRRLAKQGVLL